jgi:hypothetical protein
MTKPKLFEPLNAPVSSTVPNSWKSLKSQLDNNFRLAIINYDTALMSDTLFRMSDLHWFIKLTWAGHTVRFLQRFRFLRVACFYTESWRWLLREHPTVFYLLGSLSLILGLNTNNSLEFLC